MFALLSTILGSGDVISKGMDLIDDAFESDEEKRESKTKAKIDLMKAYAPFKIAQRYLALMFGATYLFSFFLVLTLTLLGHSVDQVFDVLEEFKVGWIMMTIIMFYFGGGMVESIGNAKKKGS
jgi:hypothetical protein